MERGRQEGPVTEEVTSKFHLLLTFWNILNLTLIIHCESIEENTRWVTYCVHICFMVVYI